MKIIDFEKKGNLVRFYLGKNDCNKYHGDDWNDAPYEHNAGKVYEQYVEDVQDIVFPFEWLVLEPCENYERHYSKEDMRNRKVPCIIAVPKEVQSWESDFYYYVGNANILKFYFDDKMNLSDKIQIWGQEN